MAHSYYKKPKVKKNRRKRRKIEKRVASAQKKKSSGKLLRSAKSATEKPKSSTKSTTRSKFNKTAIIIGGILLALAFVVGRLGKHIKFDNNKNSSSVTEQVAPTLQTSNNNAAPPLLLDPPTETELEKHQNLIAGILEKKDDFLLKTSATHGQVKPEDLNQTIEDANAYMYKVLDNKGKFTYRLNLNPDVNVPPKYNMLRHAGSIYSMVMYEQATGDGSHVQDIVNATNWLKQTGLKPAGKEGMLGIWTYDRITGSDAADQVKLGGAGLSLVAMLSTEMLAKGTTSLKELQQLGAFILYMQRKDGSFYSKFIPSKGGRDASWTSLYYPGEAALGLVMLYEYDHDPKWLMGAAKALGYLSRLRIGKSTVEADHWALLATARLLPLYDRLENPPVSKNMILEHGIQICGSMLDQGRTSMIQPHQYGCFTFDGRTTPTSTRMEGLQAALTFIPTSHTILRERIQAAVDLGITFLINSQIKEGTHKGTILRGTRQLEAGMNEKDLRTFNRRATEFRIDYVQHPLSAFIQYKERKGI